MMRKEAKTTIFKVLIALAVILFLWSCQKAEKVSTDTIDPTGAHIIYWYQHSQEREAALKTLISRFNAENSWKITVEGEYAGNYPDIFNKMSAGISGGVTPNLVVAYQNDASSYRRADALADINTYVADAHYGISKKSLADYFPDFLAQDVSEAFGGERLGWPPNRSVEVLYYNKDWLKSIGFSAPPKNWHEFAEACKRATNPALGTVGYEVKTDASTLFAQVISRGGNFQTAQVKGYKLDSPETRDSISLMQTLYAHGYARKIATPFGDQTDFANKKTLFVMDSSSGIPYYERAISGSPQGAFAWGVAAIPHETPTPVLNVYGASVSIVKSTPQKQLASWLFLRWMSEPQQQAEWVRASNYFPVRRSTTTELSDYLKNHQAFSQAFDVLKSSTQVSEPPFEGYEQVRDAIATAFNAVLDGADIDTTLATLQKKAEKQFKHVTNGK